MKPRSTPEATFSDVQHIKIKITDIGNFKISLPNLFGDDKLLEETAHTIINENWREFIDILRPAIEQAIEAVVKDRLTKILNYIPTTYLIENFH